jgi:hypothetical protein
MATQTQMPYPEISGTNASLSAARDDRGPTGVPGSVKTSSQSSNYHFNAPASTFQAPIGTPGFFPPRINLDAPRPIPNCQRSARTQDAKESAPFKSISTLDMIRQLDPGATSLGFDLTDNPSDTKISRGKHAGVRSGGPSGLNEDTLYIDSSDDPIQALGMYVQDAWDLFDR